MLARCKCDITAVFGIVFGIFPQACEIKYMFGLGGRFAFSTSVITSLTFGLVCNLYTGQKSKSAPKYVIYYVFDRETIELICYNYLIA